MARTGIALVLMLLFGPCALAQAPYQGVTPEGGEPPSPKSPPPGYQYVTWPGFRVSSGGSEVFLQLTGPVTHKERATPDRVIVTMDKVLVHLKNSLRPVITRNFAGTPVSQFRLRRLKGDQMRLEITLRRRASHSVTMKTVGQYHYLVVAFFPSGARASAPPAGTGSK